MISLNSFTVHFGKFCSWDQLPRCWTGFVYLLLCYGSWFFCCFWFHSSSFSFPHTFSLFPCQSLLCWSRYFCMVVVSFQLILLLVLGAALSICSEAMQVHSPSCPSDLISCCPSLLQFEQESCFFFSLYSGVHLKVTLIVRKDIV